jgi:phosphosulfolactate phosphohydrolase-like enzyme
MAEAFGRLAALRPANTSEAELYEVPASTQINATLYICNQNAAEVTVDVAHTDTDGAAAVEDWILSGYIIEANNTINISLALTAGEWIRVKTNTADKVSFVLEGLKIT